MPMGAWQQIEGPNTFLVPSTLATIFLSPSCVAGGAWGSWTLIRRGWRVLVKTSLLYRAHTRANRWSVDPG
jgi:hypothetical protein